MNMGTVAQQQQNRKVDMQFIQDPDSYCAQMVATARDHKLSLFKDSIMEKLPAPRRNAHYIFRKRPYGHHSSVKFFKPSQLSGPPVTTNPNRTSQSPGTSSRLFARCTKPKFRPYGYVPSHPSTQQPIGRPYWLVAPPQRQNSLSCLSSTMYIPPICNTLIGWLPVFSQPASVSTLFYPSASRCFSPNFFSAVVISVSPFPLHAWLSYSLEPC